ncbi:MAG: TolC family protein [Bacteroidetes bacterium]|nr:TolC family protein [Bacteroidota bacterium]
MQLTIAEVIRLAKDQSLDALVAKHRFRASYWQYRTHRAEYLPALSLDANPVNLNRSMVRITNPDGTESFVYQNLLRSSGTVTINQNMGFTGGSVFINSDLQRITLLGDSITASYMATPVSIGFRQPLFAFNQLKWDKKIEPMKYEEAGKDYVEALETISNKAVNLFFDLVMAQINLKVAGMNHANNDTLYKIAEGRYNIGTISKNELLQMELSLLNSGTALNAAKIDLEVKKFALRSFLGYNEKVNIELIVPQEIPALEIEFGQAFEEAKKNNPLMLQL